MRVGPGRSGRGAAALVSSALAVACLGPVAEAGAELTQRGDLFVSFSGGIAPAALPRERLAPVAVRVAGRVRTLSGERLPALRSIRVELNRAGRLRTAGLPVCHRSQIVASTSRQALAACGGALVGTGSYAGRSSFPEQASFPARGRILAFNSRSGGRPAILAHVYGTYPVPTTRVVAFGIERPRRGAYGTVLRGGLPASVNRWGYLRRISLRFYRRYRHGGRAHGYISAACAAPPGFPAATFPFARASMAFEDGRRLSSVLVRSCRVKG